MFERLFRRVGADYGQWKALTCAGIKRDMRESAMSTAVNYGRTGNRSFISLLFFYLLSGLVFVPIVLSCHNIFMSATTLLSYTMFMVGSLILVEYHAVVISPDDFAVLGYRPLSSPTFFLVKITNLLFYVMTFTSVTAFPAVIAYFFVRGFNPLIGLTAFVVVCLANITVSLAVVMLYAVVLRKVAIKRLQNIMSILQIGLAFSVYSGVFLLPRLLEDQAFLSMSPENTPWLLLLPSAWFSGALSLAVGEATAAQMLLLLVALSILLLLGFASIGKLSLDYSSDVARLAAMSYGKKSRKRMARKLLFFWLSPEEKVVGKLIRNQFLSDNKFKMAVLAILPTTFFYVFMGMQNGPLPNPFVNPSVQLLKSGVLYLIIFLFPMMLRTFVTQSDSYQASWLFYVTPAEVPGLVLSEKNYLMLYFVLPFLVILGIVFSYHFDNFLHVLLHILMLGILSHLFLQFAFLYSPDLPFSRPNIKGQRSRNIALLIVLIPFAIYLVLPLIFKHVYSSVPSYIVFLSTLLLVSALIESLIRVRVQHYTRKLEFLA